MTKRSSDWPLLPLNDGFDFPQVGVMSFRKDVADDVKDIRYKKGKVIKPGTDVSVIDSGNVIYYDGRAGYTMVINGEQYTVITERDVVVVE